MKGKQNYWGALLLMGVPFLLIMGCALEETIVNPNARYVRIIPEPKDSRVVVKSMIESNIRTLTPPFEYRYILRPYQATYIEVTHDGYRRQIIKLDGTRENIHVKLQKLTEEEIMTERYRRGASGSSGMAGPGLSDIPGVGGDMGGSMGGGGAGFGP